MADEFSRALSEFQKENPTFAEEKANQHFFLQTARAMAKDVSLGQPAVLRKVNLADIFTEAAQAATAHEDDRQRRIERLEARIKELEAANQANTSSAADEHASEPSSTTSKAGRS